MLYRFLVLLVGAVLLASPSQGQSPEDWQQQVDYEMDITLHADDHQYTGRQTLTYTNNSPDTLDTVYYHLYFNAFHPESMFAERHRHLPDPDGRTVPRIFNLDPDEQGWHRIRSLTQDGQAVEYDVTDTVMRVDLAEPIPPGASTTFKMNWKSQVPLQTRRSGRDSRGDRIDYTMTQWYPKMAEYDERGWHANFYVNREYYAPFGSFDVEITLPTEYTVGATGLLQNPEEIGHGYDIEGDGSWRPSDGLPDTDSLTWHFTAENVHNFAWSADPDYIHDKVEEDGTTHHILYKPDVSEQWTQFKTDMPNLTAFFNQEYGDYPYPQMTVAQGGDGGMEYPMFTVVSSYDGPAFKDKSSYRSVLGTTVHEFAHMWYYAALGSNEADYAWMDEGFTSYATSEGMAHLTDGTASHSPQSIVRLQRMGLFEALNTPADWYETNIGYGVASYPGGELYVDMLGYVMGEDNRDAWLKRYFRERKFQHPDPYDLELFAEEESGLMLDWYFYQFMESTRQLDDEIDDLKNTSSGDGYEASFTLEREGQIRMPHDVKLTLEDGSTQWVNVPLASMHGHKPVPNDWTVTEPWPWVQPEKTVSVEVPAPVEQAELDPKGRTPDVDRLNNSTGFPLETRFLRAPESNWSQYELGIRPLGLYADNFGWGGGLQARGQYFMGDHTLRAMLTVWPQVLASNGDDPSLTRNLDLLREDGPYENYTVDPGSWIGGLDYEFRYRRSFPPFGPRSTIEASAAKHLGVLENRLSVRTSLRSPLTDANEHLRVSLIHQLNPSDRVRNGRLSQAVATPQEDLVQVTLVENPWGKSQTVSARVDYTVEQGGDYIDAFLEVGSAVRPYTPNFNVPSQSSSLDQATRVSLFAQKTTSLGPLTGQANLRFGYADTGLLPHKRFELGGRSLEARWRNDTYRQSSALLSDVEGFGPSGPVGFSTDGEKILSGRLSLRGAPFPDVNPLSPLRLSVFSGVGNAWNEGLLFAGFQTDDLVADAGLGARYNVSEIPHLDRWTAQSDFLQGLDIVAKLPVWTGGPDFPNGDNLFGGPLLIGVEL